MEKECTIKDISANFSSKRLNSFGLYESCVANKSQGYFVLSQMILNLHYSMADNQAKGINLDELNSQRNLNLLGVCTLTKDCSEASIAALHQDYFGQAKMMDNAIPSGLAVQSFSPEIRNHKFLNFDYFSTYFLIFTALVIAFAVLSTIVTKFLRRKYQKELSKNSILEDNFDKSQAKQLQIEIEKRLKSKIWHHFDLAANFKKITNPPRFKDTISQTFFLAKPIASLWVLFLHETLERRNLSETYLRDANSWMTFEKKNPSFAIFQLGYFSVPIFFFIGGFVSIISIEKFYQKSRQAGKNSFTIFVYLSFRRYFRYAPVLFLVTLYYAFVMEDLGSSPYTLIFGQRNSYTCGVSKVWLELSLIYPMSPYKCAAWTWYIQSDFYMYLVSILVVMTTRGKVERVVVLGLIIGFSFVLTGVYYYQNYLKEGDVTIMEVYFRTFYRLRVYFTGCLAGYFVELSKGLGKCEKELNKGEKIVEQEEKKNQENEFLRFSRREEGGDELAGSDVIKSSSGRRGRKGTIWVEDFKPPQNPFEEPGEEDQDFRSHIVSVEARGLRIEGKECKKPNKIVL